MRSLETLLAVVDAACSSAKGLGSYTALGRCTTGAPQTINYTKSNTTAALSYCTCHHTRGAQGQAVKISGKQRRQEGWKATTASCPPREGRMETRRHTLAAPTQALPSMSLDRDRATPPNGCAERACSCRVRPAAFKSLARTCSSPPRLLGAPGEPPRRCPPPSPGSARPLRRCRRRGQRREGVAAWCGKQGGGRGQSASGGWVLAAEHTPCAHRSSLTLPRPAQPRPAPNSRESLCAVGPNKTGFILGFEVAAWRGRAEPRDGRLAAAAAGRAAARAARPLVARVARPRCLASNQNERSTPSEVCGGQRRLASWRPPADTSGLRAQAAQRSRVHAAGVKQSLCLCSRAPEELAAQVVRHPVPGFVRPL